VPATLARKVVAATSESWKVSALIDEQVPDRIH